MRYVKVLAWTAAFIVLLTAAQYGSVHLLTGRPSSWLFEASLDVAPPLLFAGDMAQSFISHDSQAPLEHELKALTLGMFVNIALYGATAMVAVWLFFPPNRPPAATLRGPGRLPQRSKRDDRSSGRNEQSS